MENEKKSPYVIKAVPGKYAWCACGQSKNLPHCDGSHKGTEFIPFIEEVLTEKTIAICSCRQTANGVYCDGSHTK